MRRGAEAQDARHLGPGRVSRGPEGRRDLTRRPELVGHPPRRRAAFPDRRGDPVGVRRAARRLARRGGEGERGHRGLGAVPPAVRERRLLELPAVPVRVRCPDSRPEELRREGQRLMGNRPLGARPAPEGGGARPVPGDRRGPARRTADARVRGGQRLFRAEGPGPPARDRAADRRGLQEDARPVQPPSGGGPRVLARDRERGRVPRDHQLHDPRLREADRGEGEPHLLPRRAEPRGDPPRGGARRPAPPAGRSRRAPLRSAAAEARPGRGGAAARRRECRGRRHGRRLLPADQPHRLLRRRGPAGERPVRYREDLVHRRRARHADLPGRPPQEPAPGGGRPLGAGARPLRAERLERVLGGLDAVDRSNSRYLSGLSDYLEVLQAQRQLFPAENALARTRFDRLSTLVQLYRALGGGWLEPQHAS